METDKKKPEPERRGTSELTRLLYGEMVRLSKYDDDVCELIDENETHLLVLTPGGNRISWKKPVYERKAK